MMELLVFIWIPVLLFIAICIIISDRNGKKWEKAKRERAERERLLNLPSGLPWDKSENEGLWKEREKR